MSDYLNILKNERTQTNKQNKEQKLELELDPYHQEEYVKAWAPVLITTTTVTIPTKKLNELLLCLFNIA